MTPMQPDQTKIKHQLDRIRESVALILAEMQVTQTILKPETEVWLTDVMTDSIIRRLCKYMKGQAEHGGDFLTKDIKIVSMMQEEGDDLFFYFERFKYDVAKMIAKRGGEIK